MNRSSFLGPSDFPAFVRSIRRDCTSGPWWSRRISDRGTTWDSSDCSPSGPRSTSSHLCGSGGLERKRRVSFAWTPIFLFFKNIRSPYWDCLWTSVGSWHSRSRHISRILWTNFQVAGIKKKKEAQFKKRLLDPVLKECFFSCLLDRVWQFAPGHIAPNVGLHLGIHCETVGSGCHVVKLTNFSSSSKLLHFFSSVRSMLFFLPSVTVAASAADSYLRFRFLYDLSAGKDKKRRQIQTRKTLS